jgi:hypothetical protein
MLQGTKVPYVPLKHVVIYQTLPPPTTSDTRRCEVTHFFNMAEITQPSTVAGLSPMKKHGRGKGSSFFFSFLGRGSRGIVG